MKESIFCSTPDQAREINLLRSPVFEKRDEAFVGAPSFLCFRAVNTAAADASITDKPRKSKYFRSSSTEGRFLLFGPNPSSRSTE